MKEGNNMKFEEAERIRDAADDDYKKTLWKLLLCETAEEAAKIYGKTTSSTRQAFEDFIEDYALDRDFCVELRSSLIERDFNKNLCNYIFWNLDGYESTIEELLACWSIALDTAESRALIYCCAARDWNVAELFASGMLENVTETDKYKLVRNLTDLPD